MSVLYSPTPATANQMAELLTEIKKLTSSDGQAMNELNVQINSQYFTNRFGQGNNGEVLNVFVERDGTTFNVLATNR